MSRERARCSEAGGACQARPVPWYARLANDAGTGEHHVFGDALDSAPAWADRDDVDFESPICLDAFRAAVSGGDGRHASRDPDDIFDSDRASDRACAAVGLAGGSLRAEI